MWIPDERNKDIEHLDSVVWLDAPRPRRWHRCKPQSRGWVQMFSYYERCACGAIRRNHEGSWMERNSRD